MTHENEATDLPEGASGAADAVAVQSLDIVNQYHAGNINKGDAIYEFTKAIPVGEIETEESPGKTLESYISMLDDWDRERTLSDANEQREGAQDEPNSDVDKRACKRAGRSEEDE
jgi:hypothetical protein